MENHSKYVNDDDQLELPPGFRFHPTDEELITHYLCKKAADYKFVATAISDVDMNKVEPWELPWKAKMGEKEWYFFCVRDKKYPTGMRANRATAAGYWKATGKDKEIFKGKSLVGMKKTLVFYKGRAPKGQKTNWVSHEYGLEGKLTLHNLSRSNKNDWVICRVFHKSSKGNENPILNILQSSSQGKEIINAVSILPTLMDTSASFCETKNSSSIVPESGHVHCFSNSINALKSQEDMFWTYLNPPFMGGSNSEGILSKGPFTSALGQVSPLLGAYPMHDHGFLKALMENCGQNIRNNFKTEERFTTSSFRDMGKKSLEDQEPPSTSVESQGLDYPWNY